MVSSFEQSVPCKKWGPYISVRKRCRLSVALALTSVTLFIPSAYGQSPANLPGSSDTEVAAAQVSQFSKLEKKFLPEKPRPTDLGDEVAALVADNADLREQLRKLDEQEKDQLEQQRVMLEQQRVMMELVDRLQKRLDGSTVAEESRPAEPPSPGEAGGDLALSSSKVGASLSSLRAPQGDANTADDRYKDAIILLDSGEHAKIPFQLRFTNISQFRYLNTLATNDNFTDHLGIVRPV